VNSGARTVSDEFEEMISKNVGFLKEIFFVGKLKHAECGRKTGDLIA
jgi:hypothetical protein